MYVTLVRMREADHLAQNKITMSDILTTEDFLCDVSTEQDAVPQETFATSSVPIIALLTVLMVWIGGGNCLVVAAIIKGPKSMHTFNNYLILQLAVADLMVAACMSFHMSLYIVPSLHNNIYLCALKYAVIILSLGGSVCALLGMTYDRLDAILHPLTHRKDITVRRAVLWCFVIWTVPVCEFLCTIFWHTKFEEMAVKSTDMLAVVKPEFTKYILFPLMYISFILLIILNIPILRIVYKQSDNTDNGGTSVLRSPLGRVIHKSEQVRTATMVTVRASLMVYAAFFVCWIPYTLINSIQLYGDLLQQPLLTTMSVYSSFIAIMNSGINPLIYAYSRNDFRQQFKQLLAIKN